jgi:hypothetical protein
MAKSKGGKSGKFRSATSGRYVTKKYGRANPRKVVEEHDKKR